MLLPVAYPDAELVAVEYLRPIFDPVHVGLRVPNPRPNQFITLRRIGGTADRLFDTARLDFYTWAAKDEDAQDLSMAVRHAIAAMPGVRGGVRVADTAEFTGPLPAPDDSNQPRWLVTFDITLRGQAL